jgi:hypothetical protein
MPCRPPPATTRLKAEDFHRVLQLNHELVRNLKCAGMKRRPSSTRYAMAEPRSSWLGVR